MSDFAWLAVTLMFFGGGAICLAAFVAWLDHKDSTPGAGRGE